MTAKADLVEVTNLSTFGNWRDLTNDLVGIAQISMTLGGSEINNGDLSLNGHIILSPSKTLKADNITSTDNQDAITLSKDVVRVRGEGAKIEINSSDNDGVTTSGKIQFTRSDAFIDTFFIRTNSSHSQLQIGVAVQSQPDIFFTLDDQGVMTSSTVKISSDMIDDDINGISIGQTTADAGKFTKLECTGTGGTGDINNVRIGESQPNTINVTKISIDPDPDSILNSDDINDLAGSITNTTIGSEYPRSGTFTNISTSAGVTGTNGILGYGDVYDTNGNKIVDTVAGTFNGSVTGIDTSAVRIVLNSIYPVGSVYITTADGNPSTLMNWPGSTWERFSEGRTLLGYHTGVGITALEYVGSNKYDVTFTTSDHGFSHGEQMQLNTAGPTMSEFSVDITQNKVATVLDVSGPTVTVSIQGNPVPVGGTIFTIQNNFRAVMLGMGESEQTGGATSVTLQTHQIADHVHSNKGWNGEQFYLYNDANRPVTNVQGQLRAQGPTGRYDAHLNKYGGKVFGYEDTGVGVVEKEVGKPHNNMSPFVTTYMWKRTA